MPRASSPLWVEGPSARTSPTRTSWPSETTGFWFTQVFWLERRNFATRVDLPPELHVGSVLLALLVLDDYVVAGDLGHLARALCEHDLPGVASRAGLDTGADVGRLGDEQRDGLLLHVGAHERPVGVVVLDEGDESRGDREDLLGRDVHQVNFRRRDVVDLAGGAVGGRGRTDAHAGTLRPATYEDPVADEVARGVERRGGLGDHVLLFLVRGVVDDLVGDAAVDDLAVGSLDEPVVVDPGIAGQVADQADVRPLRCLDRAHAAVVGRVHVSDLEPGALARQSARAEGRQAALVGEARQRVVLVHELRQLARAEELLDGGDDRTDVDQRLGVIASTSWVVMRSLTTRSMRDSPMRTWFWMSSPTERMRRLAKWSWSSRR